MAADFAVGYGDEEQALSAINVTPLVDVTLVLLIVFMITVPVIVGNAHVKVDVPETNSADVQSDLLPLEFSLVRSSHGECALYLNGDRVTEADVLKVFGASEAFNKDRSVSLSADRGIVYGDLMKVINMLKSLRFKKLSLETRQIEPR